MGYIVGLCVARLLVPSYCLLQSSHAGQVIRGYLDLLEEEESWPIMTSQETSQTGVVALLMGIFGTKERSDWLLNQRLYAVDIP